MEATPKPTISDKVVLDLIQIGKKEPEFLIVLEELIAHIASTYADKYENQEAPTIVTKHQLYSQERGKIINTYQMSKYLQRYIADKKFEKGENKKDLFKICHYALFDCVRQNRVLDVKNIDSKN